MLLLALAACLSLAPTSAEAEPGGPPFERTARQCEPGRVTQVLPAGPYAYVGYRAADGADRWIATLATGRPPQPGEAADFVRYGERQGFHSDRLGREYRTVTVWESEDDMMGFVLGDAHAQAMVDGGEMSDPDKGARVVRWEITPDALPLDMGEVQARTDDEGRQVLQGRQVLY